MENTFKVGDVVVLKSYDGVNGTPKMTVGYVKSDSVVCDYFSHLTEEFREKTFHPEQLRLFQDTDNR